MSSVFATVVMERVLDLVAVLALLAIYVWGFAGESDLPPRLLNPDQGLRDGGSGGRRHAAGDHVGAGHSSRANRGAGGGARACPAWKAVEPGRCSWPARSAADSPRHAAFGSSSWRSSGHLFSGSVSRLKPGRSRSPSGFRCRFPVPSCSSRCWSSASQCRRPGGVGSFHEAYRLGVTTFFGASRDQAVAAAIVTHLISFIPPVLGGILFMAQDGLSFGRLEDLASSARDKEGPAANEVPVLRSSGR